MAGETSNRAEIAVKVGKEIFKWFGWDWIPVMDENFDCHKPDKHAKKTKKGFEKDKHTHPVDIVFKYFDPYLNRNIYLSTDLKSYAKGSINPSRIKKALVSLAQALDCARGSLEWKRRYVLDGECKSNCVSALV